LENGQKRQDAGTDQEQRISHGIPDFRTEGNLEFQVLGDVFEGRLQIAGRLVDLNHADQEG
jgi:hypothetical protein